MQTGPNDRQIILTVPVPVLVLDITAAVEEDGSVHLFNDIYGHDKSLNALPAKGPPYPGQGAYLEFSLSSHNVSMYMWKGRCKRDGTRPCINESRLKSIPPRVNRNNEDMDHLPSLLSEQTSKRFDKTMLPFFVQFGIARK